MRCELEIRELPGVLQEVADLGSELRIRPVRKGQAVAKVEWICHGTCELIADLNAGDGRSALICGVGADASNCCPAMRAAAAS